MRKRGLVWFSAAAMGFLSIAIPLQLDKEWITLGWALQGLALTALWKRLDHAGLKYFGLTLLAVVTVRLVANPQILDYHPSSSVPIFNWLMYTYLFPVAALLGSAWNLHKLELERRLEWEEPIYTGGHPLGAISCSLSAILVVFVWINLTIFDFFSTGSRLTISLEHMAARDLTQSLAKITKHGVILQLKGDLLFESGQATIKPKALPVLEGLARYISKTSRDVDVLGHTDNRPIGTAVFPSNWELSAARAGRAVRYLAEKGVPAQRLRAIGHADSVPVASNTTQVGRAANRRVEFVFVTRLREDDGRSRAAGGRVEQLVPRRSP